MMQPSVDHIDGDTSARQSNMTNTTQQQPATIDNTTLLATDSVIAALVDENRLSQMLMQLSFRKIIRVHQAASAAASGEQKLERCEVVNERSPPTPGRQSRSACNTSQQHDIHRNVMIIRMLQRAKLHYQRSLQLLQSQAVLRQTLATNTHATNADDDTNVASSASPPSDEHDDGNVQCVTIISSTRKRSISGATVTDTSPTTHNSSKCQSAKSPRLQIGANHHHTSTSGYTCVRTDDRHRHHSTSTTSSSSSVQMQHMISTNNSSSKSCIPCFS